MATVDPTQFSSLSNYLASANQTPVENNTGYSPELAAQDANLLKNENFDLGAIASGNYDLLNHNNAAYQAYTPGESIADVIKPLATQYVQASNPTASAVASPTIFNSSPTSTGVDNTINTTPSDQSTSLFNGPVSTSATPKQMYNAPFIMPTQPLVSGFNPTTYTTPENTASSGLSQAGQDYLNSYKAYNAPGNVDYQAIGQDVTGITPGAAATIATLSAIIANMKNGGTIANAAGTGTGSAAGAASALAGGSTSSSAAATAAAAAAAAAAATKAATQTDVTKATPAITSNGVKLNTPSTPTSGTHVGGYTSSDGTNISSWTPGFTINDNGIAVPDSSGVSASTAANIGSVLSKITGIPLLSLGLPALMSFINDQNQKAADAFNADRNMMDTTTTGGAMNVGGEPANAGEAQAAANQAANPVEQAQPTPVTPEQTAAAVASGNDLSPAEQIQAAQEAAAAQAAAQQAAAQAAAQQQAAALAAQQAAAAQAAAQAEAQRQATSMDGLTPSLDGEGSFNGNFTNAYGVSFTPQQVASITGTNLNYTRYGMPVFTTNDGENSTYATIGNYQSGNPSAGGSGGSSWSSSGGMNMSSSDMHALAGLSGYGGGV